MGSHKVQTITISNKLSDSNCRPVNPTPTKARGKALQGESIDHRLHWYNLRAVDPGNRVVNAVRKQAGGKKSALKAKRVSSPGSDSNGCIKKKSEVKRVRFEEAVQIETSTTPPSTPPQFRVVKKNTSKPVNPSRCPGPIG